MRQDVPIRKKVLLIAGTMQDGSYFFRMRYSIDSPSIICKSFSEYEILKMFRRKAPFSLEDVDMGTAFYGPVRNSHIVLPQIISILRRRGMEKLFDMNTPKMYS